MPGYFGRYPGLENEPVFFARDFNMPVYFGRYPGLFFLSGHTGVGMQCAGIFLPVNGTAFLAGTAFGGIRDHLNMPGYAGIPDPAYQGGIFTSGYIPTLTLKILNSFRTVTVVCGVALPRDSCVSTRIEHHLNLSLSR